MRRLAPLLALLLVLGGLAACGSKHDRTAPVGAQPLDIVLDYLPNADHVGLYAAQADGDFRAAGLDVKLRVPSDPSAPLKLLAAGKVDLAISYEPELLLARDKGLRLVSVGAIVQKPLTSIVSVGRHAIARPAQLAGKTVGTAGIPYQSAYLRTILAHAGVSPRRVKQVNVGFNLVPAMLSGRVDATLGAFWNYEAIDLAQRHKRPRVIRMEAAGVPTYDELVVVARRETLLRQGAKVRRFMQALGRGYAAARSSPEAAVDALVAANPSLDRKLQLASVKATLPVFFPDREGRPFGWQDPAQWRAYGMWMQRNGLVTKAPEAQDALTNEFLAGQGI
jgi:putative hydroxymethylpyrimidine transport system substrate-binding protein